MKSNGDHDLPKQNWMQNHGHDEGNVVVGQSIESMAIRRKRMASGTI